MIGRGLGGVDIYAYCQPVDLRRHWEGLSALVREEMGRDPLSGAMFLFTNKRRTLAKVLRFDGTGLCIYAKRIEKARFAALWKFTERKTLPLKRSELELFLEGSHLVARFQVSPRVLSDADLASPIPTVHKGTRASSRASGGSGNRIEGRRDARQGE
jgi:transposase